MNTTYITEDLPEDHFIRVCTYPEYPDVVEYYARYHITDGSVHGQDVSVGKRCYKTERAARQAIALHAARMTH